MTTERELWLIDRNTGIGGSDASVILDINPWKSKLQLYKEKAEGLIVKEDNDNPNFKWGHILEPVIADEYQKETGRAIAIVPRQLIHKKYSFIHANVDRLIFDYNDTSRGWGVLEIKTKSAFINWEDDEIPPYYYSQIQHYLSVTGYSWASFVAFDMGKKKLIILDVDRDENYIDNLIKEEIKFWDMVTDKIPPEPDSTKACEEFLKNTYKKEEPGKSIDLVNNEISNERALILKIVKEQIKELEEKETYCKNCLMDIMGDAEIGIGNGYKVTWKKPKDSLKFDEDSFMIDHKLLYKKYLKPKENTRRFSVKFDKE